MKVSNTAITMMLAAGALALSFGQAYAAPHTHKVDCDKNGKTLQKEVDKAHIGDTVLVEGTCNENVIISTDNLTVVADGAATIDGSGDPDATAAVSIRASNVTLRGFTIIAARNGVILQRAGSAVIASNDISGAANHAVLVTQASYARVGGDSSDEGNTIHDSGRGVTVRNGSGADIFFNTLTGDGTPRTVVDGAFINDDRGIQITDNGAADISDNTIDGFDRGLNLLTGGNANLSASFGSTGGASTFKNNVTAIRCRLGGNATASVDQIDGGGNTALVSAFGCHVSSSVVVVVP